MDSLAHPFSQRGVEQLKLYLVQASKALILFLNDDD